MPEMQAKVVLVTGASSGIGRAAALRFAAEGASLALVGRPGQTSGAAGALAGVAAAVEDSGGRAAVIAADLTRQADLERVVPETVAAFGGLDVLVNAAGIIASGSIETTTLADWDSMMAINARAPFYLMQQAMPFLVERQGSVVNVSSVTGIRAFADVLAYSVSKAAVDQLTHCAALEMAPKGVRINAVNPGVTVTDLHRRGGMEAAAYAAFLEHSKTTHPLGRVGQPEEIAELIYFLASPRAGWITGGSFPIDGGRHQTCAR